MSESIAPTGDNGAGELARLFSDIQRLVELLDHHGEEQWSRWARRSLSEIQRRDAHGLQRLRGAYGGMGSFNDLVLDAGEDCRRANAELDALRSRIYDDVTTLLRSHGGEGSAGPAR